jgi:hypothetical protein
MASPDGQSLDVYTGADQNSLDINGELNKLAYKVSFGHGIHAGIHFRSSSYWSILLGEQVALSVLTDRAKSYNEPFRSTSRNSTARRPLSRRNDRIVTDGEVGLGRRRQRWTFYEPRKRCSPLTEAIHFGNDQHSGVISEQGMRGSKDQEH